MTDKKEKQKEVKVSKEDLSKDKIKDQDKPDNTGQNKAAGEKEDSLSEITKLLQITQANFENYRKQTEKRMNEIKTMAAQDVLIQVLPLLDHLELALKNVNPKFNCNSDCNSGCDTEGNRNVGCNCGCDAENNCDYTRDCNPDCNCGVNCDNGAEGHSINYAEFIRGIELIHSQLKNLLANNHLKQIKAVGEQFDPYYHEALMKAESDFPEGIILEEFQKGFTLHGKVIRHAKVKISSGKNTPTEKV